MDTRERHHDTIEPWTLDQGEAMWWLLGLPPESADAIITDPPYSSGGRSASARRRSPSTKYARGTKVVHPEFEGDNRDQHSWLVWMTLWLSAAFRVAKKGAPICLFSDWRQVPATSDALQAGGFVWRGTVSWDKTGAARPMRGRFTQQCEYLLWGSKGPMATDRSCLSESNILPGIFRHRVNPEDKHHIAGKPTELMLDIVRICEPGGVIVDPLPARARRAWPRYSSVIDSSVVSSCPTTRISRDSGSKKRLATWFPSIRENSSRSAARHGLDDETREKTCQRSDFVPER